MPAVIHAVSERRLDLAVIHQKCRDLDTVLLVNHAFVDVPGDHLYACARQLRIHITANMNVESVGLFQMFHHRLSTFWTPYRKRRFSSHGPAGKPEIGNSHSVVGVQVSEKKPGDVRERNVKLINPLRRAPPAIEDKFLFAGFNQNARAKPRHHWPWIARAKQGHLEILRVGSRSERRDDQKAECNLNSGHLSKSLNHPGTQRTGSSVSPVPSVFMRLLLLRYCASPRSANPQTLTSLRFHPHPA